MGYNVDANGTIKFKNLVNETELKNYLKEIEFDYYFDEVEYIKDKNQLNVYCSWNHYHEPDDVLAQLTKEYPAKENSSIEYTGEDHSYWRYRYVENSHQWIEENGYVAYDGDECRIINLYDCDTNYLVRTNVPGEVIDKALEYKNDLLINDQPISSDFEAMQEYIWKINPEYVFEAVGYVSDIESYEW